jgi:hypothetical protein
MNETRSETSVWVAPLATPSAVGHKYMRHRQLLLSIGASMTPTFDNSGPWPDADGLTGRYPLAADPRGRR